MESWDFVKTVEEERGVIVGGGRLGQRAYFLHCDESPPQMVVWFLHEHVNLRPVQKTKNKKHNNHSLLTEISLVSWIK